MSKKQLLIALPVTTALFAPILSRGWITFYYGEPFEGSHVGCRPYPIYDCENWEGLPWSAFPLDWFGKADDMYHCGDLIQINFSDGSEPMLVRAMDTCPGCLHNGAGKKFIADMPRCWRDGRKTQVGSVVNLSLFYRLYSKMHRKNQDNFVYNTKGHNHHGLTPE